MQRRYLLLLAAAGLLGAVLFPIGARRFRQGSTVVTQDSFVDADGDGLDDNFEMQCAEKFKPIVYLHRDEQYGPTAVENYLETCVLRQQGGCAWSLAEEAEAGKAKAKANLTSARGTYSKSKTGSTTQTKNRFSVGERVMTQWTKEEGGNDQWYQGIVTAIQYPDQVTIKYDDGDTWTGSEAYVKAAWESVGEDQHRFKVGDRCFTQWTRAEGGDDQWYGGLITHVSGTQTISIQYDDGSTWTGEERYCLLAPSGDVAWDPDNSANHGYCKADRSVSTRLTPCGWRDPDHTKGRATTSLISQYQNCKSCYLRCLDCNGHTCDNMGNGKANGRGVFGDALRNVPYYIHVLPDNRFGNAVQIQYWFFYAMNGPTMGLGTHQGDWEHFSVITDASCSARLKYKAFAHGGAEKWEEESSGAAAIENGRQVVYSAVNSHATYLSEGQHAGGLKGITHDYTNKGDRWYPDFMINLGETTCSGGGRKPMSAATAFVDYGTSWGTASAFDGVLDWVGACPSGPYFSFNSDTPFGSTCRR